jgi:hypothetical protein
MADLQNWDLPEGWVLKKSKNEIQQMYVYKDKSVYPVLELEEIWTKELLGWKFNNSSFQKGTQTITSREKAMIEIGKIQKQVTRINNLLLEKPLTRSTLGYLVNKESTRTPLHTMVIKLMREGNNEETFTFDDLALYFNYNIVTKEIRTKDTKEDLAYAKTDGEKTPLEFVFITPGVIGSTCNNTEKQKEMGVRIIKLLGSYVPGHEWESRDERSPGTIKDGRLYMLANHCNFDLSKVQQQIGSGRNRKNRKTRRRSS